MIADFDASPGEQRHASAQIGELRALFEIELGAGGTHLIVEMMNYRIMLFADVAVGRVGFGAALFGCGSFESRRIVIGSREDGLAAQGADTGFVEHGAEAFGLPGGAFALGGLDHAAARDGVGIVERGDGLMQALAHIRRKLIERRAVIRKLVQQGGGFAHAFGESAIGGRYGIAIRICLGFEQA